MSFDLRSVPFSRYGSYLAISQMIAKGDEPPGLYVRSVHTATRNSRCLRLRLAHEGSPVECRVTATPSSVRMESDRGWIEAAFDGVKALRFRGQGVGLLLDYPQPGGGEAALPRGPQRWQLRLFDRRINFMLTPLHGQLHVDAPWDRTHCTKIEVLAEPDPGSEIFELAVEEFACEWVQRAYTTPFEQLKQEVAAELERFIRGLPKVPRSLAAAREQAGYVLWASVVSPEGLMTRTAMLMSKNWMNRVWSWDNCFNAMALAAGNPDLAWEQIRLMFDHQDAMGALPDAVGDGDIIRDFVKPPVYGWALRWISRRSSMLTPSRLAEIYEPLCRLTEWWFTSRDDDRDGICQYNHGNDSGWDNASVFAAGCPVESPDLQAGLVVQMDFLSDTAAVLNRSDDADRWRKRADRLLRQLLEKLWQDDQFVAAVPETSWVEPDATGDSLLLYMPIILGDRLPADIREKMIASLRQSGRFFTKHGYATESPKSPLYEADGYWRGPIWAPATMILADGLARSGQQGLAHEIARRFCRMAAQSGFAENFDAQTGEGLRDRAYTWTASVFLTLASEFLLGEK